MADAESSLIPSVGFMRLRQVLGVFPVSRSAWWQGIRDGRYPRGIKLSKRTTAWRVQDIKNLIDSAGKNSDDEAA